jgi:hypothetical protein
MILALFHGIILEFTWNVEIQKKTMELISKVTKDSEI